MAKRRWETDYWLWAVASVAVFVPLGFVDLLGEGVKMESSLWAYAGLLLEGGHHTPAVAGVLLFQAAFLAVPAAAVGWVVQAVVVACGARLTPAPDRQPVRDYAEPEAAPDGPSARPPRPVESPRCP